MKYRGQLNAVSPVVAVILMVAITVILSAIIGTFVLELAQQTTKSSSSNVGVQTHFTDGEYTVTIVTGTTEELQILVNNSIRANTSNPSAGDSLSVSVSPGSTINIVSVESSGHRTVLLSETINSKSKLITAPSEGLVSHWNLNEGSGTLAYDSGLDNNSGDISGATWGTSSQFDPTLSFDGSNDYIDTGNNTARNQEFTLSAWVQVKTTSGTQEIIDKWYNNPSASSGSYLFRFESGKLYLYIDGTGGSNYAIHTSSNISINKWYHVVGKYNGSGLSLYINGTKANSTSPAVTRTTVKDTLHIGARQSATKNYLNGSLADVRIYNHSLSSQEISELYNATK